MVVQEQRHRALSFRDELLARIQPREDFKFIVRTFEETRTDLIIEAKRHRITNPKLFKELDKLNSILRNEFPLIVSIGGKNQTEVDETMKDVISLAEERGILITGLESYSNHLRYPNSRYIILSTR